MKKAILTLTASLFAVLAPAQNLISSGSPLYKLPYKNTYVMQTLVAENTFRTAKVEKPKPGTFEQARKVLPSPYWEGHPKEIGVADRSEERLSAARRFGLRHLIHLARL